MSRLTINSNIASLNAQRSFGTATNKLRESFTRLSSGLRINKASDDAAGLSVSSLLKADTRIYNQGIRNINDGISYLNVAESALTELSNIVTRISELAEQSANGTLGNDQRGALQQEVTALQSEYSRIIKTTSFNGNQLLTGYTTNTVLQGGYGQEGQLAVQVGDASLGIADDLTRAGLTTRIDTASDGTVGNGFSDFPVISADGRYVAFSSNANNLVSGDTNGRYDAFIKDTLTGETTRVSTDSSGAQANGYSFVAAISADGRYVAFRSDASNLVLDDTNGVQDAFIKDTLTGETKRVSTDSSGVQANGSSAVTAISADGRYIAFDSLATNLVSDDTNGTWDAFIKDTLTGETKRVSTDSSGAQANASSVVNAISADGRYVAFDSGATNLVSGDTNGTQDAFIKDILTGETKRVNTDSSGAEANGPTRVTAISADGRYVAFYSFATNLVSGDTNGVWDAFIKDTLTGEIKRVSTDSSGVQLNVDSSASAISADGRFAVFSSNSVSYLRDLSTAGIQEIAGMVVSNQVSAKVTLDLSKKYQTELSKYRGGIGASLSRAESFVNNLKSAATSFEAAASQITDADIAEESSKLAANQIIQQAAASVLQQTNLQPQLVLKLLGGI